MPIRLVSPKLSKDPDTKGAPKDRVLWLLAPLSAPSEFSFAMVRRADGRALTRLATAQLKAQKAGLPRVDHRFCEDDDFEDEYFEIVSEPLTQEIQRQTSANTSKASSSTQSSSSTSVSSRIHSGAGFPIFAPLGYMNTVLPLNVINTILLRELAPDFRTLKALSLTCRYLCEKTRPALFRHIHLSLYPGRRFKPGYCYLDLFTASRYLLPHIQHVSLFNIFEDDTDADDDALRVIMNLPSVRRISLNGCFSRSWSDIEDNVRRAIEQILRGKEVSQVDVMDITDFPVYLLEGCRSLKQLSLNGTPSCCPSTLKQALGYRTMMFMIGQDSPPPTSIEQLSLTSFSSTQNLVDVVEWLLSQQCRLDVSGLKSLNVTNRGTINLVQRHKILSKLLHQCRNSLEEFHLDAYLPGGVVDITMPAPDALPSVDTQRDTRIPSVINVYETLDVGHLQALRRLSLAFVLPDLHDSKHHLYLLARMLGNVSHLKCLEEISVSLWILDGAGWLESREATLAFRPSLSWESLDRALAGWSAPQSLHTPSFESCHVVQNPHSNRAQCQQYPAHPATRFNSINTDDEWTSSLRSVKISFKGLKSRRNPSALLQLCLPRLAQKGILHVTNGSLFFSAEECQRHGITDMDAQW